MNCSRGCFPAVLAKDTSAQGQAANRAGSCPPSPSLSGPPGKAENQFPMGELRNSGVIDLGSLEVSRVLKQDTERRVAGEGKGF